MARQGYSYVTADNARVVFQTEGEDLKDVPRDGRTIGEVIVRGNLVMKEVNTPQKMPLSFSRLTFLSAPVVFRR